MSKTLEEACRHAYQCKGCHLWYCADDEINFCAECGYHEDALCYRCQKVDPYSWKVICKQHWQEMKRNRLRGDISPCGTCHKYRRIYRRVDGTVRCRGCQEKLSSK